MRARSASVTWSGARVPSTTARLGRPSAARLGITAVLRDPQAGCVLFDRKYDYREPAEAPTHYALVQAFQRAVDRYLADLAADLAKASGVCTELAHAR